MLPSHNAKQIGSKSITAFVGLNRLPVAADGELEDVENMTLDHYPALKTRAKRKAVYDVTGKPQGITAYWYDSTHNGLAWAAGGKLFLDGTEVESFTINTDNDTVCMVDFWGCIYIFPDGKYYDYVNSTGGVIGTGTYPDDATACPSMDYVCVHNNRLWGVKGSYIYASALGRGKGVDGDGNGAWNYFIDTDGNPAAAGSYYVSVASPGDFKSVISWDNRIIALKDNYHHEVYGDYPSNFGMRSVSRWGAENANTLTEADSRMYWVTPTKGAIQYAGGLPGNISRKANFKSAVAGGSEGTKYYVCVLDTAGTYRLFVYDDTLSAWMAEDELYVVEFINDSGRLYALVKDSATTGRILCLNPVEGEETEENLSWSVTIPDSFIADFDRLAVLKLRLKAEGETGAAMTVNVSLDGGDWVPRSEVVFEEGNVKDIVLGDMRCNSLRVKIEGTGDVTIYGVQYEVTSGGKNI